MRPSVSPQQDCCSGKPLSEGSLFIARPQSFLKSDAASYGSHDEPVTVVLPHSPMQELGPHPQIGPSQHYAQSSRAMVSRRVDRHFAGPQLSLRTLTSCVSAPETYYRESANTKSPANHTQAFSSLGSSTQLARPVLRHDSRSAEELASSPRADRLPSFQQLSQIADAGTDGHDARSVPFPNLQTYTSSGIAQSPVKTHPHFLHSQQSSPSNSYTMLNHPSPKSNRDEGPEPYPVPVSTGSYARPTDYTQRRRSFGNSMTPTFIALTASSGTSGDTRDSHYSPGTEGSSTTHTTPVDSSSSMDLTPKPMLPLPLGLQQQTSTLGVFTCDYPGCTAAPFQTQYLLNSHANVHSSDRPHYCPVKGCPRADGGRGFKRKNEMIRHGLVHDSPGYICPFCPLREHKYPRPDNLQRHVRVHHVDKDKDDPLLRGVLAQRPEGGGRGRRRRTGP